jgi:hypothetical protein
MVARLFLSDGASGCGRTHSDTPRLKKRSRNLPTILLALRTRYRVPRDYDDALRLPSRQPGFAGPTFCNDRYISIAALRQQLSVPAGKINLS